MRLNPKVFAAFVGGSSLCVTALLISHPNDPKEKDRIPAYQGPGYRMAYDGVGGIAGGGPPIGFESNNVTLLSWLPLGEFGSPGNGNDCWGYTSPSGREYAILGHSDGTGFVEITDPTNAQIIANISGAGSLWRDIKTYDHYAYAVSEGGGGIQVFDLDNIDSGQVTELASAGSGQSHNVVIDTDSGFLYRTGGDGNGLLIYDLANPAAPFEVANWADRYIHDAQVRTFTTGPYAGKQIAFCCSGYGNGSVETGMDFLDVTDKNNIIEYPRFFYSNAKYSHQCWLSDDGQYLYHNDELDETGFGLTTNSRIFNVADLNNVSLVNTFTTGSTSIDHNLYVHDGKIYMGNYTSGLRVFEMSDPTNPTEIAYFDTWPQSDQPSYNGLWSVYPFFESGTVIGSDLEKGLFVWHVGEPPLQLQFPNGLPQLLDPNGMSVLVEIIEGDGEVLDPLTAKLFYDDGSGYASTEMVFQEGAMYQAFFGPTECASDVDYYFEARTESGFLVRSPINAPTGVYTALSTTGITNASQDDMESDLGWSVSGDAADGQWDRGVPVGGGDRGDPATDADGSGQCFLTDNEDDNSDVDDGTTTLTSYTLDGTVEDGIAFIAYQRWYSNNFGSTPNTDSMPVEISNNNGASWVLLEEVTENAGVWVDKALRIDEFVTPTDQIRVRFSARDLGDGSVVEAGVDDLRIVIVECDAGVPGDLDGDGAVGPADLAILLGAWGPCPVKGDCPADFDGDGSVGAADLAILLGSWG